MKLIDLLVQELPKRGGWPAGVQRLCQSHNGMIEDYQDGGECYYLEPTLALTLADRPRVFAKYVNECDADFVTKEQYELALAASKQVEWGGEGLPPIGAEVEVMSPTYEWKKATVTAVTDTWIIAQYENGIEFAGTHRIFSDTLGWETNCSYFRKVKSQAEQLREATIASLQDSLKGSGYGLPDGAAKIVVDAIAQGKVSGLKLID